MAMGHVTSPMAMGHVTSPMAMKIWKCCWISTWFAKPLLILSTLKAEHIQKEPVLSILYNPGGVQGSVSDYFIH